jgi:hypothetical protein
MARTSGVRPSTPSNYDARCPDHGKRAAGGRTHFCEHTSHTSSRTCLSLGLNRAHRLGERWMANCTSPAVSFRLCCPPMSCSAGPAEVPVPWRVARIRPGRWPGCACIRRPWRLGRQLRHQPGRVKIGHDIWRNHVPAAVGQNQNQPAIRVALTLGTCRDAGRNPLGRGGQSVGRRILCFRKRLSRNLRKLRKRSPTLFHFRRFRSFRRCVSRN